MFQGALRRAPIGDRGTGITITAEQTGAPSTGAIRRIVARAFAGPAGDAYPTRIAHLSVVQRLLPGSAARSTQLALWNRDGVCSALRITVGACLAERDPMGVVVDAAVARIHRLRVGSVLRAVPLRGQRSVAAFHVRGIATRASPADPFWFGAGSAAASDAPQVWAPRSYFAALRAEPQDGVTAAVDLLLDPARVHAATAARLSASVDAAVRRAEAEPGDLSVTTEVQRASERGLAGGARWRCPSW